MFDAEQEPEYAIIQEPDSPHEVHEQVRASRALAVAQHDLTPHEALLLFPTTSVTARVG